MPHPRLLGTDAVDELLIGIGRTSFLEIDLRVGEPERVEFGMRAFQKAMVDKVLPGLRMFQNLPL